MCACVPNQEDERQRPPRLLPSQPQWIAPQVVDLQKMGLTGEASVNHHHCNAERTGIKQTRCDEAHLLFCEPFEAQTVKRVSKSNQTRYGTTTPGFNVWKFQPGTLRCLLARSNLQHQLFQGSPGVEEGGGEGDVPPCCCSESTPQLR